MRAVIKTGLGTFSSPERPYYIARCGRWQKAGSTPEEAIAAVRAYVGDSPPALIWAGRRIPEEPKAPPSAPTRYPTGALCSK